MVRGHCTKDDEGEYVAVLRGEMARQAVARMRKRDAEESAARSVREERAVVLPTTEESDQAG